MPAVADNEQRTVGAAPTASDKTIKRRQADDPAALPKDRNARVREQAARKLAETKGKPRPAALGLNTGELVDDALARASASFIKWLKNNLRAIEIGAAALVLAIVGYGVYDWQVAKRYEQASHALMTGVEDAFGRIVKPEDTDQGQDIEEATDLRPKFPTPQARLEAALGAYRLAAGQYPATGAGILARLGEAGELLNRRDYDGALRAFHEVLDTPLARADSDVRMSATEGVAMAIEGKGDLDGALKEFKTLENSDIRGYAEFGLYQQARLLLKKGQKEVAKALLLKAKERLGGPHQSESPSVRHEFLTGQVNALLREIDPNLAPPPTPNPYDNLTPEQIAELRKAFERMQKQAPMMPPSPTEQPAPAPTPEPARAPGDSGE